MKAMAAHPPGSFHSTPHSASPPRLSALDSPSVRPAAPRHRLRRRHILGALQHRRQSLHGPPRLVERRAYATDRPVSHRRDRRLQRRATDEGARIVHLPAHLGWSAIDDRRLHRSRCRGVESRHGMARSLASSGDRAASGSGVLEAQRGVGASGILGISGLVLRLSGFDRISRIVPIVLLRPIRLRAEPPVSLVIGGCSFHDEMGTAADLAEIG